MSEKQSQESLALIPFQDINLNEDFFDSLKRDYSGFSEWFARKAKAGEEAFVLYNKDARIQAFLYTKVETGALDDIEPKRPPKRRLKVGTFKVDAHNTKLGERFIKRIMDVAITENVKEIYVTILPKQKPLIRMLERYGFIYQGRKGEEQVLVKSLEIRTGDLLKDYPHISLEGKKHILSIKPEFHTRLFPDSILCNEIEQRQELIRDLSFTNSIHKIYVAYMRGLANVQRGDILAIYRTSDIQGKAWYRSVVTSICQVEDVKTREDFGNIEDYLDYTMPYSIFSRDELVNAFNKDGLTVIRMTYNLALNRRVTRKQLIEVLGIDRDAYMGILELSNQQFNKLLKLGVINESAIVD